MSSVYLAAKTKNIFVEHKDYIGEDLFYRSRNFTSLYDGNKYHEVKKEYKNSFKNKNKMFLKSSIIKLSKILEIKIKKHYLFKLYSRIK